MIQNTNCLFRVRFQLGRSHKAKSWCRTTEASRKCVYAFLGEAVDDYAFEAEATVAETFETITRNYPVYIVKQDGMKFCLCAAPLGAPAAAQLMDFLISCGCKKIISTGSCGVLTDLAENEFLIPVKALRDEGTSYHYLPASRYIELDKPIRDAIEQTLLTQKFRSGSVLHGQRTGSSGKHRIWCGIAEQKDVQPLRWSVPHCLLAPGSEVLLSGRFSIRQIPLQTF